MSSEYKKFLLTLHMADGSKHELPLAIPKGEKGDKGDQGERGLQGIQGEKGDQGDIGATGKSAYDLAKLGGYTGTQEEFEQMLANPVPDGSLTEDKFTDELLIATMNTYVTPEMFRSEGDTDTVAIQKCFDYVKTQSTSKRSPIKLDRNYTVDQTLILDSNINYGSYGLTLDGQGHTIEVTSDVPLLKVRGSHNRVYNLTLKYSSALENTTKSNYNSSLLTVECDTANSTFLCHGSIFKDVTCIAPVLSKNSYMKNSVGFEIVCNGTATEKAYAYMLNFKGCSASNLGTAIKITMNEHNLGCNGNLFDISSWSCHKYVDGLAEGCYFSGLVQACYLTKLDSTGTDTGIVLNPYLINNIGSLNAFDCVFYDAAWDEGSTKTVQKIWKCESTKHNTFNTVISPYSIDGDYTSSNFTLSNGNVKPVVNIPFNAINNYSRGINTVANLPSHNSLGVDGIEITSEHENITSWAGWSDKYGNPSGMPTDFSPLFKDDPWGRGTNWLRCQPNATLTFTLRPKKPVRLGACFILFSSSVTAKSKVEIINVDTGKIQEGVVVQPATQKYMVATGYGKSSVWKIKITFNIDGTGFVDERISQICGYMFHEEDGII